MSDLINRQDAIDAINHICPIDTEYDCTLLDRVDVRCVLSELPSAERKRGENISEDGFLCSVCTFGDFGGFHGYEPNFCPNCGAEMKHD